MSVERQLAARTDLARLAARYAASGRVHVAQVLEPAAAQALHANLAARTDWSLIFNRGEQVYEYDEGHRRLITAEQNAALQSAVHNAGSDAFQYLYENIRVPDWPACANAPRDALVEFACFLNSKPFLDFARQLTGRPDIGWVDCQATSFGQGHFLNVHDDDVAGKHRIAAYVLNLTPAWRPHWGGQLQFLREDGHVDEAFVPAFNALNLLRVPQAHLVTAVSPLAPPQARRLSLTGWLRRAG